MELHRKIARRLWPRSLAWQLTLPLIASLVAIALYIWLTFDSLADERRNDVVSKVLHVSKSFQNLPRGMNYNPQPSRETFLLLAVEPPIQQIAIVNSDGVSTLSAQRPRHGGAYLSTEAVTLDTPSVYTPTLLNASGSVTYWWPIDHANQPDAWLMVTASLHSVNQWKYEALFAAFAWFSAVCGFVLLVFAPIVRRTVKVISASTQFAEALSTNPNADLAQPPSSEELNRLVAALNRISKHWHHRVQLSEQASTHLRMHKVAIDLHSAVCITNGNGRIEYANKHFCVASGYEEKELLGKNVGILNSGYHDDHFFKNLWRTLALGRIWQGELCNRNKRGDTYWVQCTIAPIKDHLGRPSQYIAIQTLTSKPQPMNVASAKA
ncbi:PAS domain-containing protein [Kaarinaea lacus]